MADSFYFEWRFQDPISPRVSIGSFGTVHFGRCLRLVDLRGASIGIDAYRFSGSPIKRFVA